MSHWKDHANAAMTKAPLESRSAGLSPEDTAKAIDAAYPFGERSMHPYKVWLRERKAFFAQHGLPRNGDHRTTKERMNDLVARMGAKRGWA